MPAAGYVPAISELLATEADRTPGDALHHALFKGVQKPAEYVVPRCDDAAQSVGESGSSSSQVRVSTSVSSIAAEFETPQGGFPEALRRYSRPDLRSTWAGRNERGGRPLPPSCTPENHPQAEFLGDVPCREFVYQCLEGRYADVCDLALRPQLF